MTRLLLVRHGESEWNAQGRWQGQADPPLTERGRRQAAEASGSLGSVDAVITSDLARAAETGAILGRLLGVGHVAVEPRLRERHAGPLSGRTREEIHVAFPGLLRDDPAGFVPGPDGQPAWPEGWESDDDLWERVEIALLAIGRLVPDGDVVVVTHGGVIYTVERRLDGADRGRLANLGATWLSVEADRLRLGERILLVDRDHTQAIESDRI